MTLTIPMEPAKEGTIKGAYERHAVNRESYLRRARASAKLTIPALMPELGHDGNMDFSTPYQGIGARGVNNLASKLLLALFPPNAPFFRMVIDDAAMEKLTDEDKGVFEDALGKYEQRLLKEMEARGLRVQLFETLKHLVCNGNVCLYIPPKGTAKVYHLDKYIVVRDGVGSPQLIILKESVSPLSLPPELHAHALAYNKGDIHKSVDIYTQVKLVSAGRGKRRWDIRQEVCGMEVASTISTVPEDRCPYLALRFTCVDGEDYGRGHVEEYIGDLKSDEGLSQAIVEGSAGAAKMLWLMKSSALSSPRLVAKSPNGAIIPGNPDDLTCVQAQKHYDLQTAQVVIERIEQRLSYAFLLNSSIQRNGERVTAEEIRHMAAELEDALGGVYSILSQELQLPLVKRLIFQMEKAKQLPALPASAVKPTIVTGLEALGRGHDLTRMNVFHQQMQPLGPEVFAKYVKIGGWMQRAATAIGLDLKGIIKTEDEVAAEEQAMQQQAAMMELAAPALNLANTNIKEQGAAEEAAPAA